MLYDGLRTWSRRMALVTAAVSLITLAAPGNSTAYIEDEDPFNASVQKPPTVDPYAYGVYGPNETDFPKIGPIYNKDATKAPGDPVFGGKVRRITSEFPNPSKSDIYSKNGFWSADGKLMFHLTTSETKTIINTETGVSVDVPGDYKGFDGSFAPNYPDGANIYTWYYFDGTRLMKYLISIVDGQPVLQGGQQLVQDFGVTLGGLGGSVDWIDNSGRYMVLNINGVVKVWDDGATPKTFYGNPPAVNANTVVLNGGWIGISPDANYVVVSTEDVTSYAGNDQYYSYKINHPTPPATAGTLEAGKLFWTLCGGHGDLVSADDGTTYLVTFDCYGSAADTTMPPAIYAVNVAPSALVTGNNSAHEFGRNEQRRLNKKLFEVAWGDDGHFSGVSKGALRDWAFISVESGEDTFGRALEPSRRNPDWWTRPYMQEIVMVNVVTCQVLRVAHHRSRSVNDSYYYQPRVSASWGDGNATADVSAAWLSNFGQLKKNKKGQLTRQPYAGYADIYAVDVLASRDVPPLPAGKTDVCITP